MILSEYLGLFNICPTIIIIELIIAAQYQMLIFYLHYDLSSFAQNIVIHYACYNIAIVQFCVFRDIVRSNQSQQSLSYQCNIC